MYAPLIFSVNITSTKIIYANRNKSKWQVLVVFTKTSSQAIYTHFYTLTNNGGS